MTSAEAIKLIQAGKYKGEDAEVLFGSLMQDEKFLQRAVSKAPDFLAYIKEPSLKVCEKAIDADPNAIGHVVNQTGDLCLYAVRKNGCALKEIRNPSYAVCLEAVSQSGYAVRFVKEKEFRTPELLRAAVTGKDIASISYLNDDELTDEVCDAAIHTNPYAITHIIQKREVPDEMIFRAFRRQLELYETFCAQYNERTTEEPTSMDELISLGNNLLGSALSSRAEMSRERWLRLVEQYPKTIFPFVPKERISLSLLTAALKRAGMNIKYVAPESLSPKLCYDAVSNDGRALAYVPKEMMTPEIAKAALVNPNDYDTVAGFLGDATPQQILAVFEEMDFELKTSPFAV